MTYGAGITVSKPRLHSREREIKRNCSILTAHCVNASLKDTRKHYKKCKYHGFYRNENELKEKFNAYLKKKFPSHYGDCYQYLYRLPIPPDSKIRQPKFPLRQSTSVFYEHHLWKQWSFLPKFFSLSLSRCKSFS